jgi:hypothetical protein
MDISSGTFLLNRRYRLTGQLDGLSTDPAERWLGFDEEKGDPVLIKTWPFDSERPKQYHRGLWASELRALYKLASSRFAPQTLLSLRDAEIDNSLRRFVMVLTSDSTGYTPTSELLKSRACVPWLAGRDRKGRADLWRGLRLVLRGLRALHRHRLLHRKLTAENVFCDTAIGPRSFRVGGFEWSVRLGVPANSPATDDWSVPPEFLHASGEYGYSMDSDWFGFAMLAARLLLPCEDLAELPSNLRHSELLRRILSTPILTERERAILTRLLPEDPESRIGIADRVNEVEHRIESVVDELNESADPSLTRPLALALRLEPKFIDEVRNALRGSDDVPAAERAIRTDLNKLIPLIEKDLQNAQIGAVGRDQAVLVGERLRLLIAQWQQGQNKNWDAAFCVGMYYRPVPLQLHPLPTGRVMVALPTQIRLDPSLKRRTTSWASRIQELTYEADLTLEIGWLFDFLRCSNQLELLMRKTEFFRYSLINAPTHPTDEITVGEVRPDGLPPYLSGQRLSDYYQRKLDRADEHEPTYVLLFGDNEEEAAWADPREQRARRWRIMDVSEGSNTIRLQPADPTVRADTPPTSGYIRPDDMHGQLQLITRRLVAIRELKNHYYLLKALASPSEVSIDTKSLLPPDTLDSFLDLNKRTIIEDILRVRPIYALQGPPGTGKTTLVAHLVSHILGDDPVAQILITAPTNFAVDVLRRQVERTAIRSHESDAGRGATGALSRLHPKSMAEPSVGSSAPLAVRLYSKKHLRHGASREGSVQAVGAQLLRSSIAHLSPAACLPEHFERIRSVWRHKAAAMVDALDGRPEAGEGSTASADASNFCELVRLGANVTYCTTSSGDLEELAKGDQSFDWSIIEEAGISHGFDLALPMQAGHRWLLLGDQRQLEPHRIDYFDHILLAPNAKELLDGALSEIARLPWSAKKNMVDKDWLYRWSKQYTESDKDVFILKARDYLRTFSSVFDGCRAIAGVSSTETRGGHAAILDTQYRMHADIGALVSSVYYPQIQGGLKCESSPNTSVHHFTSPAQVRGRSIVWLDMPWVAEHNEYELTRFNPDEIIVLDSFIRTLNDSHEYGDDPAGRSFAILSPYRQQVRLINEFFSDRPPSLAGLRLRETHRRAGAPISVAHTVDQFQGDEAHAVFVSLVRNTRAERQPHEDPALPLGFLKAPSRMNVLLSRSQGLLVLIGSWRFFAHVAAAIPARMTQLDAATGYDDSPAHWRELVTTLREWFETGRAVKLDAREWLDSATPDVRSRAWDKVRDLIMTSSR